jgi:phospholipid/cholesterol/gamma-HCH transport system substrate-binding protein
MKISNETKVGVLTVVALTILVLGFNFLKGTNLFNKSRKIYAIFGHLGPLDRSNIVKMNGVDIGAVIDIQPVNRTIDSVKVTISLTRDVDIPSNSIAYIAPGLVGSSTLVIEKGDATTYLNNGDQLKTRRETNPIQDISSEVSPTLVKLRQSMDSLNQVLSNINKIFDNDTRGNLRQTVANFNMASASLAKMLNSENGPIASTLKNTNAITENLKKNNDSITAILSNTKKLTGKLSQVELNPLIDSLQKVLSSLRSAIAKATNPDGSLGALMHDKKLYNNLNDLTLSLQVLMDDIRVHPKRYFGNVIFNRKDRTGPLTSPSKKDTLP